MDTRAKDLLFESIEQALNDLKITVPGETGYEAQTKRVVELYKLKLEEDRLAAEAFARTRDADDKMVQHEEDVAEAKERLKQAYIQLIATTSIGVLGLVIPTVFNCYWMKQGFKFEEEGSISSFVFKDLIKNFGKKR